ncbi:MAG: SH3 domain-containing protein [Lachnospiraceae bacterium]|nr:SH3 domain-containing protein [Lachnospiraceae bacterium]
MVITGYPALNVSAATASSVLPASGGILAVGNGVSLKDIKAERARSAARQKAQTIHNNVNSDPAANAGDTNTLTASTSDKVDISIKAETPASKAVRDAETVNGTSIVGSAASAASMTVSESDEAKELVAEAEADALDGSASQSSEKDATVSGNSVSGDQIPEEKNEDGPTIEVSLAAGNFDSGDEDYSRLIIAQVSYYVNVRDIPSEDGEVVGKLYNNSAGEWLDKDGDWYKIKSGNVTGYVKGEFVVSGEDAVELAKKVGERVAVVTTTTLKVREEADLESSVLGLVPMEDRLTVVEENDEWVKVSIEEGDGWVNKEFVSVSTEFPKAESKAEEEARLAREEAARKAAIAAAAKAAAANKKNTGKGGGGKGGSGYNVPAGSWSVSGSGAGANVASYALQFVGNPYVYGGTSLTNGTDCSGFTSGVYRNFGVSLPHSSGAQRSMGYSVGGLANAQAGDIVCYSGHVGIYIGNGQIVHASTAKTGIKVSNASYRSVLDVRRIF